MGWREKQDPNWCAGWADCGYLVSMSTGPRFSEPLTAEESLTFLAEEGVGEIKNAILMSSHHQQYIPPPPPSRPVDVSPIVGVLVFIAFELLAIVFALMRMAK